MSQTKLAIVLHMHQPDYGLGDRDHNLLPWVRLHATKSYTDIPWLLARHPDVKMVINLSGVLVRQLKAYLDEGLRDVWWDLSHKAAEDLTPEDRVFLLDNFFSVDWDRHITPNRGYKGLLDKRGGRGGEACADDFSASDLRDLQVYLNLAWMGFAARATEPLVAELHRKGRGYTEEEKRALLELQIAMMARLPALYRERVEAGQIELVTTPMFHPILPLLIDTSAAKRCAPDRPVPRRFTFRQDAQWHVESAKALMEDFFGVEIHGMWPAEGSVSPEAAEVFAEAGVAWIASDEDVLMASLPRGTDRRQALYQPYRVPTANGDVQMIFRDHGASDAIGFAYARMSPEEAVDDLIAKVRYAGDGLSSLILDGENPWPAYVDDGRPFLEALCGRLSESADITTVRVADHLRAHPPTETLGRLHSGSWIYGNFAIWIGHPETNRAWELLLAAREFVADRVEAGADPAVVETALLELYAAEGSDWFWWYGDDFSSNNDAEFDAIFRNRVRRAYTVLGAEPPPQVHIPIYHDGATASEVVAPSRLIRPRVDGSLGRFFDWHGAGIYTPRAGTGAMARSEVWVKRLRFGFDLERLYLRLVFDESAARDTPGMRARVTFGTGEHKRRLNINLNKIGRYVTSKPLVASVVLNEALDVAVAFEDLDVEPGAQINVSVGILRNSVEVERHPAGGRLSLEVPDATFEGWNWQV